ncbi:MAG: TAXI family TRAP transporter solute-binding subunit [Gammaproteobacteria bacterium]|nr:TAXI family TRAP transporter solute-binding subunit [Gammaproteobacteria bacterium]
MKTTRFLVAGLFAASLAVSTAAVHSEELRIGTASQGGAFYPIGQGISNLVTKYAGGGMTMVPVVTAGGVQNPLLIESGEVNIGITNTNLALLANEGKGPYKDKKINLAAVAALHPSVLSMVTLAGSPIKTFADIKGKRVAVGPAGGGTLVFVNRLLEVHGMTIKDITPSFLSYNDGFSQLADGNVDAAFALAGYPTAAVTQARATKDIRFIRIPDDKFDAMLKKYPYYTRVAIPKATYRLDEDAIVLGVNNVLVVRSDMSADKVYAITKAVFDHLDEFKAENANARQIDPKASLSLPIKLHPGAARYFKP